MASVAAYMRQEDAPHELIFRTPDLDPVAYEVRCASAERIDGVVRDWSLRHLDSATYRTGLARYLSCLGARKLYAPTVSHLSGVALPAERFTTSYVLPGGVELLRPAYDEKAAGLERCDGTNLPQNTGFIMTAGGCMLITLSGITASGDPILLVGHGGRNSLVDMKLVRTGTRSRTHFSLIDTFVAWALVQGVERHTLRLRAFFSIPWEAYPHSFQNPVYGNSNRQLFFFLNQHQKDEGIFPVREDGVLCLSLPKLVEVQARRHGIELIQTGLLDLPLNGPYAYTTHTGLSDELRNLVTLVRQ